MLAAACILQSELREIAERLGIDNLEFEKKKPVGVVHPLRIISKLPNVNLKLESSSPNFYRLWGIRFEAFGLWVAAECHLGREISGRAFVEGPTADLCVAARDRCSRQRRKLLEFVAGGWITGRRTSC